MNISESKTIAATIADSMGLQLPATAQFTTLASAYEFLDTYKTIVIKPNDGSHGNGVTTRITRREHLDQALKDARAVSKSQKVLLQQQITGHDIRVLMIDGKLAAAAVRTPASVKGDGEHTIAELIEMENRSELRGENYHLSLNIIDMKAAIEFIGSNIDSIVPKLGNDVQVAGTANIGSGGTATDITDTLPDMITEQSRELTSELSLQCAGVDFIASDIEDPSTYYFIEVNASPSFGLHMKPTHGSARLVQKPFVDMLLRDSTKVFA